MEEMPSTSLLHACVLIFQTRAMSCLLADRLPQSHCPAGNWSLKQRQLAIVLVYRNDYRSDQRTIDTPQTAFSLLSIDSSASAKHRMTKRTGLTTSRMKRTFIVACTVEQIGKLRAALGKDGLVTLVSSDVELAALQGKRHYTQSTQ